MYLPTKVMKGKWQHKIPQNYAVETKVAHLDCVHLSFLSFIFSSSSFPPPFFRTPVTARARFPCAQEHLMRFMSFCYAHESSCARTEFRRVMPNFAVWYLSRTTMTTFEGQGGGATGVARLFRLGEQMSLAKSTYPKICFSPDFGHLFLKRRKNKK